MHEPVRQLAVVGEQHEAGAVDVEPPDRVQTRRRLDELDHLRPALRVVGGRHHPGRLVDQVVLELLGCDRRAVDLDLVVGVHVAGGVGHDPAVHPDPATGHEPLGVAA